MNKPDTSTTNQTRPYQLALFGHPVAHSQSPKIHQGFAAQFDLNIEYHLIDVEKDILWAQVHQFFAQDGKGANITVPHKQHIIPALDAITERAELAGAVNTLFIQNNQLWGDNTDGAGFVLDLKSKGITIKGQSILIIGAGGASKGIIPALLTECPNSIHITNRTQAKAIELANQFDSCSAVNIDTTGPSYDLIIHATSIGHQGLCPHLNSDWFNEHTTAYDLSYGQAAKPFLDTAKTLGAKASHGGLGMLYGQAALAFEIWFNKKAKID
ncbi:shikimate dehydrogenase [Marinicella rhabdoformis]|uniref:shikimate dehydrogenase n=1 Tax=Marinicella rhabdoformis TaxID=2580566 RepID=UPI0015CFD845